MTLYETIDLFLYTIVHAYEPFLRMPMFLKMIYRSFASTRPAGPMVRRLTTDQEIAGSNPA